MIKGEVYPIGSLSDAGLSADGEKAGTHISAPGILVHSANLFETDVSIPEFIVLWLGAEPTSVEYNWPNYNNVIEAGNFVYHFEKTNEDLDGASLLIDGFNAWGSAHHKYTIAVSLFINADGSTSAVLNLTTDEYDAWRQDLDDTPQYRENVRLPGGRLGDLRMMFDPNRALSPYVASIVMGENGQLVAVPHIYPGDIVLAGEKGPFGGWTQYNIPLSTYEPDAPEAVLDTPMPYDVTDEALRPERLVCQTRTK